MSPPARACTSTRSVLGATPVCQDCDSRRLPWPHAPSAAGLACVPGAGAGQGGHFEASHCGGASRLLAVALSHLRLTSLRLSFRPPHPGRRDAAAASPDAAVRGAGPGLHAAAGGGQGRAAWRGGRLRHTRPGSPHARGAGRGCHHDGGAAAQQQRGQLGWIGLCAGGATPCGHGAAPGSRGASTAVCFLGVRTGDVTPCFPLSLTSPTGGCV